MSFGPDSELIKQLGLQLYAQKHIGGLESKDAGAGET